MAMVVVASMVEFVDRFAISLGVMVVVITMVGFNIMVVVWGLVTSAIWIRVAVEIAFVFAVTEDQREEGRYVAEEGHR